MTRAITGPQFKNLWLDEFVTRVGERGRCMLCGNEGEIDTRGKVFDGAGVDCGGVAFCICPNGRELKRAVEKAQREDAA